MNRIREYIERIFELLGVFLIKFKFLILIIFVIIIGFFTMQIKKIKIDTSTEGFLHPNDPYLTQYESFKNQFGQDEMIIIAVKSSNIFTKNFLNKFKDFHNDLENNLLYLKDIVSLVNIRRTYGEGNELFVEDLLKTVPGNEEDMKILKKGIMTNSLYINNYISSDEKVTLILIEPIVYKMDKKSKDDFEELFNDFESEIDNNIESNKREKISDKEYNEIITGINNISEKYNNKNDFSIHIVGNPLVISLLKKYMMKDLRFFLVISISIIIIFLIILFRKVTGVITPMIVVISSVLTTLGLMSLLKIPIKLPTQILPSFLLVVGVGASIHIIAVFYYRVREGLLKKNAVVSSLKHSGFPIVMTSLTTAGGLFSFSFADIAPIADLGVIGGIGVIISLLYSIILTPVLLLIFPMRSKIKEEIEFKFNFVDKILIGFAKFTKNHPVKITIGSVVLILVCIGFATQLKFSHFPLSWFPKKMKLREDTEIIDKAFKGSNTLEIIINTRKKNNIYEPDVLNSIEDLTYKLKNYKNNDISVGNVLSINNVIKETNKALNDNKNESYTIPQNRKAVAQEILLFENNRPQDLEKIVDSDYMKTRITVKVPSVDAIVFKEFMDDVSKEINNIFGSKADITLTGLVPLMSRTLHASIMSSVKSYIIAFIIIAILMIILIGNLKQGLVSLIPNILPVIFIIGLMGLFGIKANMFVLFTGCIIIGLAVDDTIHFMYNFKKYYDKTGDPYEAVKKTLLTTGRAMFITSIVLCMGFIVYMFATLKNLFYFGLLSSMAVMIALLADFILAPALMFLIFKKKENN